MTYTSKTTMSSSHSEDTSLHSEDTNPLWGWEQYFEELSTFICSLGRGRIAYANESYTEYVLDRLTTCISTISRLIDYIQSAMEAVELEEDESEAIDILQSQLSQLLDCVREISIEWQTHFDRIQMNATGTVSQQGGTSFRLTINRATQGPGRPRFNITKEQLEYLSSMSFSWSQIATLLGVSRMTIYRRRAEFGLLLDPETSLSYSDLNSLVYTMRSEHPEIGETIVWGRLRSLGYRVTRERVRNALHQTDPLSSALRWRGNLTRRKPYSVPGPNSLWHIGNNNIIMTCVCVCVCAP